MTPKHGNLSLVFNRRDLAIASIFYLLLAICTWGGPLFLKAGKWAYNRLEKESNQVYADMLQGMGQEPK